MVGNQSSLVKLVLMHSFPSYYELKSGRDLFSTCEYPCTLTLDPGLAEEADSVIIYSHNFRSQDPLQALPGQIWVYFAVESPVYSGNDIFGKPEWQNRFNWTMTYRRDSDFYFGYGDYSPCAPTQPVRDFSTIIAGKSKMVAWFVSHCQTQSKREEFAAALKEFVQVDMYGHCGSLRCERERHSSCLDMLSKDYYFYLAFENSLCKDYITEKAYNSMRFADAVPVVRGGANYTALLPPGSFIDASQFPSMQALAEHLKSVASNKELYGSYLAWKNKWEVMDHVPFSFCEFCQRLHQLERWQKVYANVDSWWREGVCHDPRVIVKS